MRSRAMREEAADDAAPGFGRRSVYITWSPLSSTEMLRSSSRSENSAASSAPCTPGTRASHPSYATRQQRHSTLESAEFRMQFVGFCFCFCFSDARLRDAPPSHVLMYSFLRTKRPCRAAFVSNSTIYWRAHTRQRNVEYAIDKVLFGSTVNAN